MVVAMSTIHSFIQEVGLMLLLDNSIVAQQPFPPCICGWILMLISAHCNSGKSYSVVRGNNVSHST